MTDQAPPGSDTDRLLKPSEVISLFHVVRETLSRWVLSGKIPRDAYIVTPGGHRRYRESHIRALMNKDGGRP
jgi:predicted site-specific integrase-resolvase